MASQQAGFGNSMNEREDLESEQNQPMMISANQVLHQQA